jgi:hypothetical protein
VVWAVDTVEDKSLFTQVHCSSADQSRDKGMFQARYVRDIPPDRIFISWFHGGIHRPNGTLKHFLVVLGFELRALHSLARPLSLEQYPQSPNGPSEVTLPQVISA